MWKMKPLCPSVWEWGLEPISTGFQALSDPWSFLVSVLCEKYYLYPSLNPFLDQMLSEHRQKYWHVSSYARIFIYCEKLEINKEEIHTKQVWIVEIAVKPMEWERIMGSGRVSTLPLSAEASLKLNFTPGRWRACHAESTRCGFQAEMQMLWSKEENNIFEGLQMGTVELQCRWVGNTGLNWDAQEMRFYLAEHAGHNRKSFEMYFKLKRSSLEVCKKINDL